MQGSVELEGGYCRRVSMVDGDVEQGAGGTTKPSSLPGLLGNALGLRIPNLGGPAYQSASGRHAGPHSFKWVRHRSTVQLAPY